MQEVTIKPRSAFKHYVTVDAAGKELCWNFCTRKKNISFGLYKKSDALNDQVYGLTGVPPRSNPALSCRILVSRKDKSERNSITRY
ncbi:hypothetical protein BC829DRAFT_389075 [Chytridium lagenaria]|nr:hypothetical protein BC829DRAFT_389075 [Chytridium lagenaria]